MMKKIAITLIIIATSLSIRGYGEDSNTKTSHGAWGAKSKCPDGSGLCNVTTKVNDEAAPIVMNWTLSSDQTTLSLTISENMMLESSEQITTQLQNGHFTMDESFTFNAEMVNLLGADPDLTIPAGNYNVTHSSQGYTIHFVLE